MNFSQFYGEANKQLLEALSNLWFKGHPKEKEHFEKLISTKEPLISEPVFQSIFPWKNAEYTFMEHATKLKILTPDFVQALDKLPFSACNTFLGNFLHRRNYHTIL